MAVAANHPYSERRFGKTVALYARAIGRKTLGTALDLHYAAHSPGTPRWARGVIYGALAYLVSPLDAIPDVIPFAGFADDGLILAAALTTVAVYVTDDIKARTDQTLGRWFR